MYIWYFTLKHHDVLTFEFVNLIQDIFAFLSLYLDLLKGIFDFFLLFWRSLHLALVWLNLSWKRLYLDFERVQLLDLLLNSRFVLLFQLVNVVLFLLLPEKLSLHLARWHSSCRIRSALNVCFGQHRLRSLWEFLLSWRSSVNNLLFRNCGLLECHSVHKLRLLDIWKLGKSYHWVHRPL